MTFIGWKGALSRLVVQNDMGGDVIEQRTEGGGFTGGSDSDSRALAASEATRKSRFAALSI